MNDATSASPAPPGTSDGLTESMATSPESSSTRSSRIAGSSPGADVARKLLERAGDAVAGVLVRHHAVLAHHLALERHADAGGLDDVRVRVAQHLAQGVVGIGATGRRRGARHVDPGHGLVVGAGVADGPLEQVL